MKVEYKPQLPNLSSGSTFLWNTHMYTICTYVIKFDYFLLLICLTSFKLLEQPEKLRGRRGNFLLSHTPQTTFGSGPHQTSSGSFCCHLGFLLWVCSDARGLTGRPREASTQWLCPSSCPSAREKIQEWNREIQQNTADLLRWQYTLTKEGSTEN